MKCEPGPRGTTLRDFCATSMGAPEGRAKKVTATQSRARQSKAQQCNAKQRKRKAKQCKGNAKQSTGKHSNPNAKHSKATQSKGNAKQSNAKETQSKARQNKTRQWGRKRVRRRPHMSDVSPRVSMPNPAFRVFLRSQYLLSLGTILHRAFTSLWRRKA